MAHKIKKINLGVERRDYTKVSSDVPLPNLIEIQKETFSWFQKSGIQEVFDEFFPINSSDDSTTVFLDGWEFREPNITVEKAKEQSKIYEAPIYGQLKLSSKKKEVILKNIESEEEIETDLTSIVLNWLKEKTGQNNILFTKKIKNNFLFEIEYKNNDKNDLIQVNVLDETDELYNLEVSLFKTGEVFFGNFPLMTENGTFIINGSQKVIVSQLVRSPGVYYKKRINPINNEWIYSFNIIPSRGTWLEFETEHKKNSDDNAKSTALYVKIDKSRKTTATSLLTALGLKPQEVLRIFNNTSLIEETYSLDNLSGNWIYDFDNTVQELYKKIKQGETATEEGSSRYIKSLILDKRKYDLTKAGRFKLNQKLNIKNRILGKTIAQDVFDNNGKLVISKNTEVDKDNYTEISKILSENILLETFEFENSFTNANQIQKLDIYKDINKEEIVTLIGNLPSNDSLKLELADILASISYGMFLKHNIGEIDDIDHLGNRRVRTVGELIQNQFRLGMNRIEKNVKEKLSTSDLYKVKLSSVLNNKPLTAVIGEFFNLSQLSQFMDQINPLSELTNKRRLTALGPGGLSRDRAGLEVRDVHPSHYGRICPIETPEGPNIGLINNLSTYAKVNEYGFITTPYIKVVNGKITNEVVYLTGDEEKRFIISQADVLKDDQNQIMLPEKEIGIVCRYNSDDYIAEVNEIEYIDVSPKQIVSVATAAIPFLEHDDANRALMGANMQRQAVPLINPESPIVGTGIEFEIARDSGSAVVADFDGEITYVDSKQISLTSKEETKTYTLLNWTRSNNASALIQVPIVKTGQAIKKGQIIADGPSMDKGELAIGQNVVVAFTTYKGYNFEDAIVMSERVTMDDKFTSTHIDEYTIEVRKTKLGLEEITREIPNVSEQAKKFLEHDGIVAIGTEVKAGDILVGKVTPKGQTQLSPEDKLLHAIFGEKSRNVKDNSLKVPNKGDGIVQSVKRFKAKSSENPDGIELSPNIQEIIKVYVVQKRKIQEGDKMSGRHGNKGIISCVLPVEDMPHLEDGTPVDILLNPQGVPSRMNVGQILEIHLGMAAKKLGIKVATPVFEGLTQTELDDIMQEAGMTNYGKVKLIDGQTGEAFDKPISVGVMYMLKLSHMVDDKLHARNVGPYSLITQQPLGGKAQNGGQRFGEMEVWALEAYGAAHTLKEILTIKSDDIKGRIKTYEAIVKSNEIPESGIPESFNVLTKEIMGLGFDIRIIDKEGNKINTELNMSNIDQEVTSKFNEDNNISSEKRILEESESFSEESTIDKLNEEE